MIRPLSLFCLVLMFSFPAAAQQNERKPLYLGSSGGGTTGGNLYLGSGSGGTPLNLNQILDGRSGRAYEYQSNTSGITPYRNLVTGTQNSYGGMSPAEVEYYRNQQATDAQRREQEALANLSSYDDPQQQTQQYLNQFQNNGETGATDLAQQPTTYVYRGRGRERGEDLLTPPPVFNSVR